VKIRLVVGCALSLLVAGCAAPAGEPVRITAEPAGASIADSVRVEVDGLAAGEAVRIWARTADGEGQRWESSAEFTADGAGRVDTTSAASTGGTYRGLDPHGLFWSMRLATPEQLAAARIPVGRITGSALLTSGGDDGI
jgi:hypothetical protein